LRDPSVALWRLVTARFRVRNAALLMAIIILAAGCTRPMVVGTDRDQLAAVEIRNETGVAMIVSYESDGPRATLGSVMPGATERFIVTLPPGSTIRVHAVSETGGRTSGPHPVTLQSGTTQRITLR